MSAAKHTPEPWKVSGPHDVVGGGKCLAISADTPDGELTVATVAYNDDNPVELAACWADARLIAAAPGLLEALREVREVLFDYRSSVSDAEYFITRTCAAIKKATQP